jgi:putative acetyltransferase
VVVLALGPIGVDPAFQGEGVGSALMRGCMAAAAGTDRPLIALLGHAEYYPRFGFEPAGALGLRCPYPVAPEHWMAYRLPAYDAAVRGAFRYASAFSLAG